MTNHKTTMNYAAIVAKNSPLPQATTTITETNTTTPTTETTEVSETFVSPFGCRSEYRRIEKSPSALTETKTITRTRPYGMKSHLYKTKMCRNIESDGRCPRKNCWFAHSIKELRPIGTPPHQQPHQCRHNIQAIFEEHPQCLQLMEDTDYDYLLQKACMIGAKTIIRHLILNTDLMTSERARRNPLFVAIDSKNLEMVRFLVEELKVDKTVKTNSNLTILMAPVRDPRRYDREIFRYIFELGVVDLDAQTRAGKTALWFAASSGCEEAVKLLVEAGANTTTRSDRGDTPLMVAFREQHRGIELYLAKHTPHLPLSEEDEEDEEEREVPSEPCAECQGECFYTPIYKGHPNCVNLERVKHISRVKDLMLQKCIVWGGYEIAKKLLKERANPNTQVWGWSALFWATEYRSLRFVKLLVEAGADVHFRNAKGVSILMNAAYRGSLKIVEYLVGECGVSLLEVCAKTGQDVESFAIVGGCSEIIEYIREETRDKLSELRDVYGDTKRDLTKRHDYLDVNARYAKGRTPLMLAAAAGNNNAVHFLIENRADVDAVDEDGMTAIQLADEAGMNGTVNLLLYLGAERNNKKIHKIISKTNLPIIKIDQNFSFAEVAQAKEGEF